MLRCGRMEATTADHRQPFSSSGAVAGDSANHGDNSYDLVGDWAKTVGMDRSHAMRWLKAEKYKLHMIRGSTTRGQKSCALSSSDAIKARARRLSEFPKGEAQPVTTSSGYFYIVQLIPDHDPCRIKLGYSTSTRRRLSEYHTTCPEAKLLRKFDCEPAFEVAAIASVTRVGCVRVGEEVYDVDDVDALLARAKQFFDLMP